MWWGGPMKGRRPNAASYMQWAPGAGTSLAGLRASLWLSKLGLLIVSRQVNFNYLKVYLAHGKILASLTPQALKVQAISTVPFLHSTDTGAAPAGGGQALVYLPNLGIRMSNWEVPQKPLNFDEGRGCATAYATQFSCGIPFTNFVFYLYGLEAEDGLNVAISVSGNPFCKSCMNGIAPQFWMQIHTVLVFGVSE